MRRIIALATLGTIASCSEAREISLPVVRDSLGITVVEYSGAPDGAELFRISGTPLRLGQVDGPDEVLFSRIVAAFAGPGATTIVVDGLSREVRWFDSGGAHLRTTGGGGDGPGEFQGVNWAGPLHGDTIGVWDRGARRVSLFSSDGVLVASYAVPWVEATFPSPEGTFVIPQPQVKGVFSDGSLLADLPLAFEEMELGLRRDSIPLVLFDRNTGEWSRVGTTLTDEFHLFPDSEAFPVHPRPFGLRTRVAVAEDWVVYGWGDERGLAVVGQNGEIETLLRPGMERPILTDEEIQRDRAERLAAASDATRPELRRVLNEEVYPERKPAHGLVVASDNEIWVQESAFESAAADRWFVFSRSGRLLSSVSVPEGLQITDVGSQHVIGWRVDDLGVPTVLRFELERSGVGGEETNVR